MRPLLVLLAAALLLSGCWDMKEAQSVNFITALGVDYVDNQYIVFAQIIDFPNIAKRDMGSTATDKSSVWVGRGVGDTILLALGDIYDSSQQQTVWTHVKAIILSERVLNSRLEELFSGLLRSREMRYTPWVYGTSESIPDLLSSITLLNLSAQATEMFEPTEIYKQRSDVEPIHLQRLMNGIREPGAVVLLPSITNYNEVWMSKGKHPPLVRTNGVYVISKNKNQGYLGENKILGARYAKFRKVYRYPVSLKMEEGGHALLMLREPRCSITAEPAGEEIRLRIVMETKANILDLSPSVHITEEKLRALVQEVLAQEMRRTLAYAQKERMDVMGLEEIMYRRHYKTWKRYADEQRELLPAFKLETVDIRLNITHSNTYNMQ